MINNKNNRERIKQVEPLVINEPEGVSAIVENNSINQITIGWQNATDVASEVWRQGNITLLDGDLLFAYKNTESAESKLHQIVVVKYFDWVQVPGTQNVRKTYNGIY